MVNDAAPLKLKDTKTPIRPLGWHFTSTFSLLGPNTRFAD
jgi:hypothetical protein